MNGKWKRLTREQIDRVTSSAIAWNEAKRQHSAKAVAKELGVSIAAVRSYYSQIGRAARGTL